MRFEAGLRFRLNLTAYGGGEGAEEERRRSGGGEEVRRRRRRGVMCMCHTYQAPRELILSIENTYMIDSRMCSPYHGMCSLQRAQAPEARCKVVRQKGRRTVRGWVQSMSSPRSSHRMCKKNRKSSKSRLCVCVLCVCESVCACVCVCVVCTRACMRVRVYVRDTHTLMR